MNEQAPQIAPMGSGSRRRVVIRKIGVLSVAKVFGLVYAGIGLLLGAIVSVFSSIGSLLGTLGQGNGNALWGLLFGVGAIIFLPIFYGVLGFLVTALSAAIYNLAAGLVGGIEIEISE